MSPRLMSHSWVAEICCLLACDSVGPDSSVRAEELAAGREAGDDGREDRTELPVTDDAGVEPTDIAELALLALPLWTNGTALKGAVERCSNGGG